MYTAEIDKHPGYGSKPTQLTTCGTFFRRLKTTVPVSERPLGRCAAVGNVWQLVRFGIKSVGGLVSAVGGWIEKILALNHF